MHENLPYGLMFATAVLGSIHYALAIMEDIERRLDRNPKVGELISTPISFKFPLWLLSLIVIIIVGASVIVGYALFIHFR